MTRATQVRREKIIDEEGNIVELVIWKIPVTQQNPTGIRYRLAFIRKGERQPAVLYDNHHPKGTIATPRETSSLTTSPAWIGSLRTLWPK